MSTRQSLHDAITEAICALLAESDPARHMARIIADAICADPRVLPLIEGVGSEEWKRLHERLATAWVYVGDLRRALLRAGPRGEPVGAVQQRRTDFALVTKALQTLEYLARTYMAGSSEEARESLGVLRNALAGPTEANEPDESQVARRKRGECSCDPLPEPTDDYCPLHGEEANEPGGGAGEGDDPIAREADAAYERAKARAAPQEEHPDTAGHTSSCAVRAGEGCNCVPRPRTVDAEAAWTEAMAAMGDAWWKMRDAAEAIRAEIAAARAPSGKENA